MKRILPLLLAALLLCACAQSPAAAVSAGSTAPASAAPTATAAPTAAPASTPGENAASNVDAPWAPSHKITMIVAYKEGSGTDVGARLLLQYAQPYLGQTVEVKNISSSSGQTAWQALADADPDGYTLGFINMPNIFTAIDNGGSFTVQDFAPICTHVIETSVVVVPASSPYYTLNELIAANRTAAQAAEADPDHSAELLLRASTNGVQASNDIAAALLAYSSGAWQFRHVAYGSTSDQLNALLGGECHWSVAKVSDVLPYVTQSDDPNDLKAGTLRALALFDTERCAELPDLPTTQELGYPTGWYGSTRAIAAPAGTDPAIVEFYAQAFRRAMQDPDCVAAHRQAGLALAYMGPQALAERIDDRSRFNASLLPKLFAN